ncbi:MAG: bifunctional precorrin-2 dehydrogenase/sirohydrochlorin ferrochelatase [Deltaproteobacteria bacterium]|nr:bifunctional precorrin-2 dehydrogenase/sirohydrochlorin ferrochelatase [Deltaproteobacteria bacterium]
MKYYPIMLDIREKDCLVVGGGNVALRKVAGLAACGARVTVVSDSFLSEFAELEGNDNIFQICRPYVESDLNGRFMVIGATDNENLNREIAKSAGEKRVLCNIADLPDACDFILPSIVCRGDLIVSVSTSGASPAFAKKLRKDIENICGEEYGIFLRLMRRIRKKALASEHAPEEHKGQFETLIKSGLPEMIQQGDIKGIDRMLYDTFGPGYEYESLME